MSLAGRSTGALWTCTNKNHIVTSEFQCDICTIDLSFVHITIVTKDSCLPLGKFLLMSLEVV